MATADLRKYRNAGVLLPHHPGVAPIDNNVQAEDLQGVTGQLISERKGFLFVKNLRGRWSDDEPNSAQYLVQSLERGGLYLNKLLVRGRNALGERGGFVTQLPPELRFSTIKPGRNMDRVLPDESYFTKLDFWQKLDNRTYSLYFRWGNGGNIEDLIGSYRARGLQVPEHFIWHVAVELGEALAYLQLGRRRGGVATANMWQAIYHRNLVSKNVSLNYGPVGRGGPQRRGGLRQNAFPDVALGGFALAARDGDRGRDLMPTPTADVPLLTTFANGNNPDANAPSAWEDIHLYGVVLRQLFMAPIPAADFASRELLPECFTVRDANRRGLPAGQQRYSNQLEAWLREFEWPNMDTNYWIDGAQLINGARTPNWTHIPTAYRLLDNLLPTARAERQRHEGLLRRVYTGAADVSWTKPAELMPYVYTNERDPEVRSLDAWSTLRAPRELRFVEWAVPVLAAIDARVDVSKPEWEPTYDTDSDRGDDDVQMGGA